MSCAADARKVCHKSSEDDEENLRIIRPRIIIMKDWVSDRTTVMSINQSSQPTARMLVRA